MILTSLFFAAIAPMAEESAMSNIFRYQEEEKRGTFYEQLAQNPSLVEFYARLAELVYLRNPAERDEALRQALAFSGFIGYEKVEDLSRNGQYSGTILKKEDRDTIQIIVIFAGSKSKLDWIKNAKQWGAFGNSRIPLDIKVPKGFMDMLQESFIQFSTALTRFIEKRRDIREGRKSINLVTVGHSLGGALADLTAAAAKDILDKNRIQNTASVITFGEPLFTDKLGAEKIEKRIGIYNRIRFRDIKDIVPNVPGQNIFYVNPAAIEIITVGRAITSRVPIFAHSMGMYRHTAEDAFRHFIQANENRKWFHLSTAPQEKALSASEVIKLNKELQSLSARARKIIEGSGYFDQLILEQEIRYESVKEERKIKSLEDLDLRIKEAETKLEQAREEEAILTASAQEGSPETFMGKIKSKFAGTPLQKAHTNTQTALNELHNLLAQVPHYRDPSYAEIRREELEPDDLRQLKQALHDLLALYIEFQRLPTGQAKTDLEVQLLTKEEKLDQMIFASIMEANYPMLIYGLSEIITQYKNVLKGEKNNAKRNIYLGFIKNAQNILQELVNDAEPLVEALNAEPVSGLQLEPMSPITPVLGLEPMEPISPITPDSGFEEESFLRSEANFEQASPVFEEASPSMGTEPTTPTAKPEATLETEPYTFETEPEIDVQARKRLNFGRSNRP